MSRKPIKKPTAKQKKFANNYIQNGLTNSYQAALKAGYSKNYAKHDGYKLLENVGIRHYINQSTGSDKLADWRNRVKNQLVMKNMYQIASGLTRNSHYKMIDHKDPTNSTDQSIIGPAAIKAQVDAGKSIIQYICSPMAQAQIRRLNAKSYIDENTADEMKRENAQKHVHKQVPLVGLMKKLVKKKYQSKSNKNKK